MICAKPAGSRGIYLVFVDRRPENDLGRSYLHLSEDAAHFLGSKRVWNAWSWRRPLITTDEHIYLPILHFQRSPDAQRRSTSTICSNYAFFFPLTQLFYSSNFSCFFTGRGFYCCFSHIYANATQPEAVLTIMDFKKSQYAKHRECIHFQCTPSCRLNKCRDALEQIQEHRSRSTNNVSRYPHTAIHPEVVIHPSSARRRSLLRWTFRLCFHSSISLVHELKGGRFLSFTKAEQSPKTPSRHYFSSHSSMGFCIILQHS